MNWLSPFSALGLFCSSGFSGYSFCLWHSFWLWNFPSLRNLRVSSFHSYFGFSVSQIFLPFSYLLSTFLGAHPSGTSWKGWKTAKHLACLLYYTKFFNNLTGHKILLENSVPLEFWTHCFIACWEMLFVPWSLSFLFYLFIYLFGCTRS